MTATKRVSLLLFATSLLAATSLSAAESVDETPIRQAVKRVTDKIYYPSMAKKFALSDKVVAKVYFNAEGDLAGFEIVSPSTYDIFNQEVFSALRGTSKTVVDAPESLQAVNLVIRFKR